MMNKSISLIIPVYNVAEYLEECLESVINQTYSNLDIICVNDGSTDNSLTILEKYAQLDSRIRIINQHNQGLSVARNNGMKAAKGEYIQFLDSDDYIELNTCEEALARAIETDAELTMFSFDYVGETNDRVLPTGPCMERDVYYKEMERLKVVLDNCSTVWDYLYKTSFLQENRLEFIPGLRFEDTPFSARAALAANSIATVGKRFYHYRIRSGSVSYSKHNINQLEIPKVIYSTWEEAEKSNPSPEARKYLYETNLEYLYWLYRRFNRRNRKRFLLELKIYITPIVCPLIKDNSIALSRYANEFYLAAGGNWHCKLKRIYRYYRRKLLGKCEV